MLSLLVVGYLGYVAAGWLKRRSPCGALPGGMNGHAEVVRLQLEELRQELAASPPDEEEAEQCVELEGRLALSGQDKKASRSASLALSEVSTVDEGLGASREASETEESCGEDVELPRSASE